MPTTSPFYKNQPGHLRIPSGNCKGLDGKRARFDRDAGNGQVFVTLLEQVGPFTVGQGFTLIAERGEEFVPESCLPDSGCDESRYAVDTCNR